MFYGHPICLKADRLSGWLAAQSHLHRIGNPEDSIWRSNVKLLYRPTWDEDQIQTPLICAGGFFCQPYARRRHGVVGIKTAAIAFEDGGRQT